VGVSADSDFPPEAARLPQVATAAGLSLEGIAALHPDLVLAWKDSVRPEDIERLARFGAAVFVAQGRSLDDVPRLLRSIGALTGHDAAAAANAYVARLSALRRDYSARPTVSAFLEIWSRPLTTVSGRHFMNEALAICGARNVFAELPGVAPAVSWEELYARDPQVIVGIGSADNERDFEARWKRHGTPAAVKAGRLVYVNPDRLQRTTARTPEGISQLCAAIDRVRPR
jgi:iron complex transport system substrate-binding protein